MGVVKFAWKSRIQKMISEVDNKSGDFTFDDQIEIARWLGCLFYWNNPNRFSIVKNTRIPSYTKYLRHAIKD